MDLKIHSYVDSDYRPSSWLAFMMTSKPAGKDALLTMLPRVDTDNVVLTQNELLVIMLVGQPVRDIAVVPKPPPREVTMYHKIARNAHCDPTALLKRKLDAFASQILFLEAAGHHEEVRKYKRLQLEASTEMCDELIKLSTVHVSTTSQSNTAIDLLNSSTSSSSTYDNDSD